jgi:hypothetical protein
MVMSDVLRADEERRSKHSIRLPRFLVDEPLGLGQIVKRITKSIGVQPCGSCEDRAARLDRWLRFSPGKPGGKTHE